MSQSKVADEPTARRGRPLRAVVADDTPDSRTLVRAVLKRAGIEVVAEVEDGHAAAQAACRYQPDVVVLDYLMPYQSGLEAIAEIRACSPLSKILILSAMTEDQVDDDAARSAPDAWLPKGGAIEELGDVLNQLGCRIAGDVADRPAYVASDDVPTRDVQQLTESWSAQALVEARAAFDDTFDAAAIPMALLTTAGRFIRVNPAYQELAGLDHEQLSATAWADTLDLADAACAMSAVGQLLDGQIDRYDARVRLTRPDSTKLWGDLRLSVVHNASGLPVTLLAQIDDVTTRLEVEARLDSAFAHAAIPTALVSPEGRFVQVNRALCGMLGRSETDLTGAAWTDFVHPADAEVGLARLLTGQGASSHLEKRYVRPDGNVRWGALTASPVQDADGRPLHVVVQIQDVTARKEAQALLFHQATHDALTGLPNRTLFNDRLEVALARLARSSFSVAVMVCDLDRFKTVNDSLGHAAGDRLLVEVAERLQDAVRPADTIARFGGDEFVIACDGLAYPRDAEVIAERVRASLVDPIQIEGNTVGVTVSIGVALAYGGGHTAEELIRKADMAMYQAKDHGRACAVVYEEAMGTWAKSRLETEQDLRQAVDAGQLVVHYQPVIDLRDQSVVGVEALVRWEHAVRGLLGAPEFVPLAEETGIIVPIGRWVVEEACRQGQRWRGAYPDLDLTMSVNFSAPELAQPGLTELVERSLEHAGMPADRLCIEITETALVSAGRSARRTLDRLKALGVHIGIDDFGTGYSSLAYLQDLPVDVLKVDQTFIDGFGGAGTSESIVQAVVRLADALGLRTIAEGVEREDQAASLIELRCSAAQGFLFGRPQSPEALDAFLAGRAP